MVTRRGHGALGALGQPGLAAAQRLSVPPRYPRGFAGPTALPLLPAGLKQHTGNRQVGAQKKRFLL